MKQQLIRTAGAFCILLLAVAAMAGTWSPNNFFYQPAVGARGTTEKNNFDTGLNRVDAHLASYKTLGDPGYSTLAEAITTIGSDNVTLTIPTVTVTVASNTTVGSNIALRVFKGGKFSVNSGVTLTISGPVDAGPYQIFSGSGTVTLGGVSTIYDVWYATPPTSPTSIAAPVGASFIKTSGSAPLVYVKESGTGSSGWVASSGSSGVTAFTGLTDVPGSYGGQAGKALRVNSGASGLEFYTPSAGGASTFNSLTDVPSSYTGQSGKSLRVNSNANGLEYYSPFSGAFTGLSDAPGSYSGQAGKAVRVNSTANSLEFFTLPPSGATSFTGLNDVPGTYTSSAGKALRVNSGASGLEFYTPFSGVFTGLADAPGTYSGQAGKAIRVNSTATGLEFYAPSAGGDSMFISLTDVPSSYSGQVGKSLRVNSGGNGLEFYTPSSSGGIKPFNTLGDAGYTSLSEALTTIGSSATTLVIPADASTVSISSNTTVPANVSLKIMKGGKFAVANGVTLTINGPIEAGPWPIFSWTGSGTVNLSACPTRVFYLENWGTPAGVTNDIQPYLVKMASCGIDNKVIKVTKANWRLATPVQFTNIYGFTLEGEDPDYSSIYIDVGSTNNAMTFGVSGYDTVGGTDSGVYRYYLRNLNLTGPANCCKNGLVFSRVVHGGAYNVDMTLGATEYAVVQAGCEQFDSFWKIGLGGGNYYGQELNGFVYGKAANGVRVCPDHFGWANNTYNTLKIMKSGTFTAPGSIGLRLESVSSNFTVTGDIECCPGLPGWGVYATSCSNVKFKDLYLESDQQGISLEDCKQILIDGVTDPGCDADIGASGWMDNWKSNGGVINETNQCPIPQSIKLSNCNNVTIRNAELGQIQIGATCRGSIIENSSLSQKSGLLDFAPDTQYIGSLSFRDGYMPKIPITSYGNNTANYFPNSLLDRWQTDHPDYWSKSGTMTWTKCGAGLTNAAQHAAQYCAKFYCTAQEYPGLTLSDEVLNAFKGQLATFTMWMMPGTGQIFTDTSAWIMYLNVSVPPWMPNKAYQPGDAVCSNYMYLHPQQTDLVLAVPGLYIRGVTTGIYGLICKKDDTNHYIYIDRMRNNAFAPGETLKLTTNGLASGDTGISYTNETGTGYHTTGQKCMFVCEWGGTSGTTEPNWDDQHGAIPRTDNTCTWRYIPNEINTSAAQPAYDSTHDYQLGTWRKYVCSQFVPKNCWKIQPYWMFKPSQNGTGTYYLAEPTLTVGSLASRGVLPAANEAASCFMIGGCKFDRGTAPPADGSWCNAGDVRFNSAPAAGGPSGWMCITSGPAGSGAAWKAMGNLAN